MDKKVYSEAEMQMALRKQREQILNNSSWKYILLQIGDSPSDE